MDLPESSLFKSGVKSRIPLGRLTVEMFQVCATGKRPWGTLEGLYRPIGLGTPWDLPRRARGSSLGKRTCGCLYLLPLRYVLILLKTQKSIKTVTFDNVE